MEFLSTGIGMVLIVAGVSKVLGGREGFAETVVNFGILGKRSSRTVATTLPWAELALGGALILGAYPRIVASAAAMLFAAFAAATVYAWLRGRDRLECGCFSLRHQESSAPWVFVRAASFSLLSSCIAAGAVGDVGPLLGSSEADARVVAFLMALTITALVGVVLAMRRALPRRLEGEG